MAFCFLFVEVRHDQTYDEIVNDVDIYCQGGCVIYEQEIALFAKSAEDDLGLLLMTAASTVVAATLTELAAQGHPAIRASHVSVFVHIDPEGTAISALAERSGVSRQAMSMTVRDLEALGYVTTSPSDTDRRAILASLTGLGARLCADASRVSTEIAARWSGELGDDAVPQLRRHLRTILARSTEDGRP